MANPKDVELIKRSVSEWNKWRDEGRETRIAFSWSAPVFDADLSETDFSRADLKGVDLSFANLSRTFFWKANLDKADFWRANLWEANLKEANLKEANFYEASLNGTDVRGADLSKAYLRGVNLSRVNLSGANLTEADLSEANINATVFGDVDLSTVKGLDTIKHFGPSTIGVDTIYKSRGNIPETFLKGVGIDDSFISYIRSLVGKAIEYYSCFISYSNRDEAFARRLYADLQRHNVRCWFAPEDLKIGDKFRHRIDESIRIHDKLLLVLSEDSLASTWVGYEVEKALDKEPEGKPNVLFPIRLDKAVLTCETDWAKDIRRSRHIGDFEHWKDHDAYQVAFERLIRDLKSQQ